MSNQDTDNLNRDQIKQMSEETRDALNADPITGEPGAHPVGTGVGAAGGAAAGAAIGSVAGPLGTLVGGAIGAIVGGLAGHNAGESINPTHEEAYWREAHSHQPYFSDSTGHSYDQDYNSAYRPGYESRAAHPAARRFEEVAENRKRYYPCFQQHFC